MYRNRWPECSGMGGRNGAELVAGIKRNMHYTAVSSFLHHLIRCTYVLNSSMFKRNGFKLIDFWGDFDKSHYSIYSRRLITLAQKTKSL